MKYFAAIAAAAFAAAPVPAQEAAPAAAPAAQLDPQRLTLARQAAESIFPPGTYERLMSLSFESMTDQMMAMAFDMPLEDLLPPGSAHDQRAEQSLGGKTLRELMAAEDPHFEERYRIMNRVMGTEMVPIMTRIEPDMREALARIYANRFTAAQLADMNRFFATPSGAAFAAESMTVWGDPEVMGVMAKMTPELIKAMPAIMEKVKAASAHLPPPPEPKKARKRR